MNGICLRKWLTPRWHSLGANCQIEFFANSSKVHAVHCTINEEVQVQLCDIMLMRNTDHLRIGLETPEVLMLTYKKNMSIGIAPKAS